MRAATIALALVVLAAPIAALLAWGARARDLAASGRGARVAVLAGTLALGALLFVPAWLIEARIQAWVGVDERVRSVTDVTALLYVFAVAAPLEQGLKAAAVAPAWRWHRLITRADGVIHAGAAGLGFVTARGATLLFARSPALLDFARVALAVPAHVFFAAAWGWALARDAGPPSSRRLGGGAFNLTWLAATLLNGAYDHIVFARGAAALIATAPILLGMAIVAYVAWPELRNERAASPMARAARRRLLLPAMAPPSIRAVRDALSRAERPVMLSWIALGALVTTGVVTAALAGAVVLGHKLGVDFAAVDRGDASAAAGVAPLVLLGAAALLAFPVAGYLVARASATRTVLEPAIAAGLAIAGCLILLGLAAPIAVVFALAFAPIAFGLACAGAWVGMSR